MRGRACGAWEEIGSSMCQEVCAGVPSAVLSCSRGEARLVVPGGHALRHFTDEVADEHMGFLDAWHRRGRDTDGDIGDVCQFPLLPKEGHRSRAELLGCA